MRKVPCPLTGAIASEPKTADNQETGASANGVRTWVGSEAAPRAGLPTTVRYHEAMRIVAIVLRDCCDRPVTSHRRPQAGHGASGAATLAVDYFQGINSL